MTLSSQDRIASVASGGLGSLTVGLAAMLLELFNQVLLRTMGDTVVLTTFSYNQMAESVLCAAMSGFLFGVTYGYIRRSDCHK